MKIVKRQKGFGLIEILVGLAIVGVLQAYALPAYRDYVIRAYVAEGIQMAGGLRTKLAEFVEWNGYSIARGAFNGNGCKYWKDPATGGYSLCQLNAEYGIAEPESFKSDPIEAIVVSKIVSAVPGESNGDAGIYILVAYNKDYVPVTSAGALHVLRLQLVNSIQVYADNLNKDFLNPNEGSLRFSCKDPTKDPALRLPDKWLPPICKNNVI
ncbi:MAG: type II secretion system protein [Neisseriaceae bacterium]|nr:type II secretion system protein [Neisseriaceae bacterium]